MDPISHSVLFLAAACFVLGVINLRLWFGDRARRDLLAMASVCLFGAQYCLFEVEWIHVVSPQDYGEILRWSQLASWGTIVSLAVFVKLYLNAGRMWLLWGAVGFRTLGMLLNFAMPVNIQFREITAMGQVSILGEQLSYPIGVPNPWHLVYVLSFVFLFALGADALVTASRRGERRRALIFGGGVALLSLIALAIVVAVVWFSAGIPAFTSPVLIVVVFGMAIEFDYDLRRSSRLAAQLTSRDAELTEMSSNLDLSASAAQVGIWVKEPGGRLLASRKMRELFDLDDSEPLVAGDLISRVHPDDRRRVERAQNLALDAGQPYEAEFRIQLGNGEIRWMHSMGRVQTLDNGKKLLRGASVDITRRKLAEGDAHELSGKLIVAQEKERARLARELHDDLSQRLAILSIQLQSLGNESAGPDAIRKNVEKLTGEIQGLSSEVHRISHELHPSKLNQLGLEAALRGFCRETGSAHGMKVAFRSTNAKCAIPNDISLCVYRIAQESLQNAVKHSGASSANVDLRVDNDVLKLVVSDNGCGFDPVAVKSKESLGLISMEERIRAVDGTLSVESVLDSGTRIEAHVPLPIN